jgi:hypothetical protein
VVVPRIPVEADDAQGRMNASHNAAMRGNTRLTHCGCGCDRRAASSTQPQGMRPVT